MYGATGLPVEYGEVFRSREDASALVTIVGLIVVFPYLVIIGSLRDVTSCAIHRTRCCLADEFGMSVAVEVVDHELRVVGTGTDVFTQIDAPKFRAIQLKAVDDDITRIAVVGIVVGIRWVPF